MRRDKLPPVGNVYMLGGDGPDGEEPPDGEVFVTLRAKVEDARRMKMREDHVLVPVAEYERLARDHKAMEALRAGDVSVKFEKGLWRVRRKVKHIVLEEHADNDLAEAISSAMAKTWAAP